MTAPRVIALVLVAGLFLVSLLQRGGEEGAPVLWVPSDLSDLLGLEIDEYAPPAVPQVAPGQGDAVGMVLVPAGPFVAGYDDGERDLVSRTVEVGAFQIDIHEVTNRQYMDFVQDVTYPPPPYWEDERYNALEAPVVGVSWHDARAYCWWTRKRLPTEMEWEKAARGTGGPAFPWGDKYAPALANLLGPDDGFAGLAPAGSFPTGASPFGALDMVGNVWEWCRDRYDPFAYRPSPTGGDVDEEIRRGSYLEHRRVIRGGAWISSPEFVRGVARDGLHPSARGIHFGFRCARDAR